MGRDPRVSRPPPRASQVILFIDELHTVVGAGAAEGALDCSNRRTLQPHAYPMPTRAYAYSTCLPMPTLCLAHVSERLRPVAQRDRPPQP